MLWKHKWMRVEKNIQTPFWSASSSVTTRRFFYNALQSSKRRRGIGCTCYTSGSLCSRTVVWFTKRSIQTWTNLYLRQNTIEIRKNAGAWSNSLIFSPKVKYYATHSRSSLRYISQDRSSQSHLCIKDISQWKSCSFIELNFLNIYIIVLFPSNGQKFRQDTLKSISLCFSRTSSTEISSRSLTYHEFHMEEHKFCV